MNLECPGGSSNRCQSVCLTPNELRIDPNSLRHRSLPAPSSQTARPLSKTIRTRRSQERCNELLQDDNAEVKCLNI